MSHPKGGTISGKLQLHGNPQSGNVINTGAQVDRNPSVAELTHYNIRVQSVESNLSYHGSMTDVRTTLELRTIQTNNNGLGSDGIKQVEQLIADIGKLSRIKTSKNAGVKDLWGQLETLLALTEERDK